MYCFFIGDVGIYYSMKKSDRKKLEDRVWAECRRIIREAYPHECYTCGAVNLEGSNLQTGHGKPKGALTLKYKYDLRNLRPQCLRCNFHHGGCTDIFLARLEKEKGEGLEFLKEACYKTEDGYWKIKGNETMGGKDATFFLENLLIEYKELHYE